jgi:DNA-binding transcriptional regulator YdaS (Cro superfamily)
MLDITPGAISQWHRVPAERVIEVERLTGIPRSELRPDIFGPPSEAATSTAPEAA